MGGEGCPFEGPRAGRAAALGGTAGIQQARPRYFVQNDRARAGRAPRRPDDRTCPGRQQKPLPEPIAPSTPRPVRSGHQRSELSRPSQLPASEQTPEPVPPGEARRRRPAREQRRDGGLGGRPPPHLFGGLWKTDLAPNPSPRIWGLKAEPSIVRFCPGWSPGPLGSRGQSHRDSPARQVLGRRPWPQRGG